MRLVSFALPDGAECYLVFLAGNGGGALKNVNRWRAQLGQAPIDEAGLRVLERVQMLGAQRPMLEAYSREGQGMLATLADGGERTLFVKLIGTEAAVRSQIPGFRALCKSLRFSK